MRVAFEGEIGVARVGRGEEWWWLNPFPLVVVAVPLDSVTSSY